jgi:hypothetical protein
MTTLAETLGLTSGAPSEATSQDAEALEEFEAIEVDSNVSMKELFTKMLETRAYRRSIYIRLVTGSLPPAVECKIIDHVAGKPVDRIEIEDKTKSVDHLSIEELHERQERTLMAMKKILDAQNTESRH